MASPRIMVAVDGSEPSDRALAFAATAAKCRGAHLDIVNILDLRSIDAYEGFYLTEEQLERLEERAHESVLKKADTLIPEGVEAKTRLLRGSAPKLLASEAEGALMVVVGKTGKSAWDRVLEGSVSRSLVPRCPVPLVIVP